MKTIEINGRQYKVKYSLRSLFIFEQITDKPFALTSTLDKTLFYYCLVLANNKDTELTFDEFVDAIDENPNLINEFNTILTDYQKSQSVFESGETDEDGKKKE